jgi:5-methylcytosine-specific restriction endonuclease McrA
VIVLHIAATASEWRAAVLERDGHQCQSMQHADDCGYYPRLEAHHIVYKGQLGERAFWIVENGICLSYECHALAHKTHNASIGFRRANAAVVAVNCVESVPHRKFTKKGMAA